MAIIATGVDSTGNNSGVSFSVTVVFNNITRVIAVSIDDLTGAPAAIVEFDPALKIILRAMWYGASGTSAQKIAALKAGVNLTAVTMKIHDFANNVDITS